MPYPLRPLPFGSAPLEGFGTMRKADLETFFSLLLKASLRLDTITKRLAPTLTTIESYVLSAIADGDGCIASDLTETLAVAKSALSKTLKHLSEKGYLQIEGESKDKRRKHLRLSTQGIEAWQFDTKIKNQQMEEFVRPLSKKEAQELLNLLRAFADASTVPNPIPGHDEHPFRAQVIRVTRALGFLGDNLMGSGVDSYRVQILHFCGQFPRGVPFREIDESIPYDKSVISRIITDFEAQGLISKIHHSLDRRTVEVVLTARGWEERTRIEELCCGMLKKFLKSLPRDFLERTLPLLQKALDRVVHVDFSASGPRFELVRIGKDRRVARGLAIQLLAQQSLQQEVSFHSFSSGNILYTLSRSGAPDGVVEVRRRGMVGEILLWIFNPMTFSSKDALLLLNDIKEHAQARFDLKNFITSWRPLIEAVHGADTSRQSSLPSTINL